MQVKVFRIRLGDDYRAQDEAALNEFLDGINVTQVFASVVQEVWSVLVTYEPDASEPEAFDEDTEEEHLEPEVPLSDEENAAYERLKQWRAERAAEERVPAYFIAHNSWLKALVKIPVRTADDLRHVKGFGDKRIRKYGEEIVRVLNGGVDARPDKPMYLDF